MDEVIEQELNALRERDAYMSAQMAEFESRIETLEKLLEVLTDSVDIVSDFAIVHQQHHEAVTKIARGEKQIELMQAGYMLEDIDKRDRDRRKREAMSPKAREITGVHYIQEEVRRA